MTKDKQQYQIIIVGGGPAGIATSLTLSSRGISNCIIEALKEPTRKPGEAIPPNAKPILKQLGLNHLVEDPKHAVYYGNKSCWGTDTLEQKEFIQEIHGPGYLLDRLYFESQLRETVKTSGGKLFSGYKLKKIANIKQGVKVTIENGSIKSTLEGSYIVDCTGRKASVCRKLGITKTTIDSQFTLAFNISIPSAVEQQILIEATMNGWWYLAPCGKQELTLMFFTLQELIPDKKDIKSFLIKELKTCIHISKIISTAVLDIKNVKIMSTGTSCLDIPYGENWIAVGDAAYSYDPISSYGITSALASGFYAGHALADSLSGKKVALPVYRYVVENAFQAYMEKLSKHYSIEQRWNDSAYWKNRFKTSD